MKLWWEICSPPFSPSVYNALLLDVSPLKTSVTGNLHTNPHFTSREIHAPASHSSFWIFWGPICSSDTSQPPASLSRGFLTGTREPVTRKHFPAYARGTWIFFPSLHYSVHSPIYKLLWAISSTVDKPGNITEAAPCICDLCFLLNIKLPRLGTSIFWNGTHGNIWWTGENRSLWPVTHTCPFESNLSFPATGSGIWAQQLEFQYPCMLYSWGSLDSSHPGTDHPQMQL